MLLVVGEQGAEPLGDERGDFGVPGVQHAGTGPDVVRGDPLGSGAAADRERPLGLLP